MMSVTHAALAIATNAIELRTAAPCVLTTTATESQLPGIIGIGLVSEAISMGRVATLFLTLRTLFYTVNRKSTRLGK